MHETTGTQTEETQRVSEMKPHCRTANIQGKTQQHQHKTHKKTL